MGGGDVDMKKKTLMGYTGVGEVPGSAGYQQKGKAERTSDKVFGLDCKGNTG